MTAPESAPLPVLELVVPPDAAPDRTDRLLGKLAEPHGLSRSAVQKMLAQGHILRRDGVPIVKGSDTAGPPGTVYALTLPTPEPARPQGQDIPLDVVWEDEHALVVNKPAGLSVHPAPGHADGTLVNALVHYCGAQLSSMGGERRPGLVHRLDIGTSGLLLVAKSDRAHRQLGKDLERRLISREYTALVQGEPKETGGTIDQPLGRDPSDRIRRAVVKKDAPDARTAKTHWSIDRRFHGAALLAVKLETGRTHQVRVHMAWSGHPVVGDKLYGYDPGAIIFRQQPHAQPSLKVALAELKRPFLHARRLTFRHPATLQPVTVEAPLPADLTRLLEALEKWAR